MNNTKKFEDFLDKMQGLLDNAKKQGHIIVRVEDLESTFPELKEYEDEDERIRKALIEMVHDTTGDSLWVDYNVHKEDALAWLEKQGKQDSIINVPPKEVILSIWDLGNEWKELTNGSISTEHGTQLDYIQKHWHECEYYLREKQGNEPKKVTCMQEVEVDNANIIDKVAPKFKVGYWVIDKQGITHQIANVIENVTNYTYGYDIVGGGYFNDKTEGVRLWTIQDAKDGDVLVASDGSLFIFAKVKDNSAYYHFSLCKNGSQEISDGNHAWETANSCHPATKEQREKLFKAMHETGYKWDAEKKKLCKIEHEPKWTEEDKQNLNMALDYIYDDYLRNWLKQKIEEQWE